MSPANKKPRDPQQPESNKDGKDWGDASRNETVAMFTMASLNYFQRTRRLQGATLYLIPVENDIFKKGPEVGRLYAGEAAAKGKGHALGPPHGSLAVGGAAAALDNLVDQQKQCLLPVADEWNKLPEAIAKVTKSEYKVRIVMR